MSNAAIDHKPIRMGVFDTVKEAETKVSELLTAGFTRDEVTVVCSDDTKERYFLEFEHQQPSGTVTPGAAAMGSFVGASIGGLTALAAGALTGGVALAIFGGAGLFTGGIVGGFVGAMMTRGVEKELADFYDQAVLDGRILIAVDIHGPDAERRLHEAEKILSDGNADAMPMDEA